jgi:ribosomal protein S27AE
MKIIPKFDTKRVLQDGWKTYLYAAQNWWADLKFNISSWWFWRAKGWPFKKHCPECAGRKTKIKHSAEYDCGRCNATGLVDRRP